MNRAHQIRKNKPFALGDVVVYACLAVVIALLFVLFLGRTQNATQGVKVEIRGEEVYRYEFGIGGSVVEGVSASIEESREDNTLYIRIKTEYGYNVICIDDEQKLVWMFDADCSRRKDCTHMFALGDGGEVILCLPHFLRIVPLAGEDLSKPGIG